MAVTQSVIDDSTFQQTLESLYSLSFSAIQSDDSHQLEELSRSIASLEEIIDSSRGNLAPKSLQNATIFLELVANMVSTVLEADEPEEALVREIMLDLEKLSLESVGTEINSGMSRQHSRCHESHLDLVDLSDEATALLEPHIQAAYDWLLSNFHNPYPTKDVRANIATSHNVSRKVVDSWFIDVRKRIGWNSFCKEHYESRKDMVDAATAFFLGASSSSVRQPKSASDPAFIFITLENRVRGLYASKLGTAVEVEVVEVATRGRKRADCAEEQEEEMRVRPAKRSRRAAYPSPASSEGTPEPFVVSRKSSEERETYVFLVSLLQFRSKC